MRKHVEMPDAAGLSPTQESYLETIAALIESKGNARVRDIAECLSVHKSTVTSAVRTLAEKDLVNHAPYDMITLTPTGNELASRILRRHRIILTFLSEILGIDSGTADANACRMEHVMDRSVLNRLALFAEYARKQHPNHDRWRTNFINFCKARDDNPSKTVSGDSSRRKNETS